MHLMCLIFFSSKIIVAKINEVIIDVKAENVGETGYQCQLFIDTLDDIELSQNSLCTSENDTFVCPFASKLTTSKQVYLKINNLI